MNIQINLDTNASEDVRSRDASFLQALATTLLGGTAPVLPVNIVTNVTGEKSASEKALEAVAAAAVAKSTNPAAEDEDGDDGAEFDTAGFPWDERIHSGGKTKVKKTGLWTLKRGVDEALVKQVQNEFMNRPTPMPAAAGVPVPPAPVPAAPAPAPVPAAPAAPTAAPVEQAPAVPAAPASAPAPVSEPAAVQTAEPVTAYNIDDAQVFPTCVATYNELQAAGKIPAGLMEGLYAENGVTGFGQLATNRTASRAILNVLLQLK